MAHLGASAPADLGALSGLAPELATAFVSLASDVALVIDEQGTVTHAAAAPGPAPAGAAGLAQATHWVGRPWADTVTPDTRPKIEQLLAEARHPGVARQREVNHACAHGGDPIPVRYAALRLGASGPLLAVGRDLRPAAELQQRFGEAQREMTRDHWRQQQLQSRQRLLAQVAADAVLVVQRPTLRAIAANATARHWWGEPGQALPPPLHPLLARAAMDEQAAQARVQLPHGPQGAELLTLDVSVMPLPQADPPHPAPLLLRARRAEAGPDPAPETDAVLITDAAGRLLMADAALLAWVGADAEAPLLGRPVTQLLGDPHRQLAALLHDVRRLGMASQPAATLGPPGAPWQVAMSASLLAEGEPPPVALVLHRLDAPPVPLPPLDLVALLQCMARRVGQLPLDALLREASDATERHAIETALAAADGRHDEAAQQLGIEAASLRQRMQRLGLLLPPDTA